MAMQNIYLAVLLLGTVALCSASPARMFFNEGNRHNSPNLNVVTVDCSNKEAVKFVSKTHANFRCVYPDERQRTFAARNSNNPPLLFSSNVGVCQPGQVYDPQNRVCITTGDAPNFPSGLQSASLTREDPNSCPPGHIFVPEIGICLVANRPTRTNSLESDNLVVEQPKMEITSFSSSVQFPSDCKRDEVYNSELSICMKVNPGKAVRPLSTLNLVKPRPAPLEIQSFSSPVRSAADCKIDEMYVAEINTCVGLSSGSIFPEAASLVRDSSFSSSPSVTRGDCARDEVFVSEIGICLPANPPKVKKPIVSGSLVREQASSVPMAFPINCKSDEVFSPEIGICMPVRPFNRPRPVAPVSSSLVKEPVKLEITAFETSKTLADCPPGTIFVSEIGECLHP